VKKIIIVSKIYLLLNIVLAVISFSINWSR